MVKWERFWRNFLDDKKKSLRIQLKAQSTINWMSTLIIDERKTIKAWHWLQINQNDFNRLIETCVCFCLRKINSLHSSPDDQDNAATWSSEHTHKPVMSVSAILFPIIKYYIWIRNEFVVERKISALKCAVIISTWNRFKVTQTVQNKIGLNSFCQFKKNCVDQKSNKFEVKNLKNV